ncbi:recombinase family protein, partial [Klebsiella pneumoniae]|uniref:recombinase family protein n=1 Tax=Klebsiella pneumoniae TaxID=573 RepID=UPI001EED759B
YIDNVSGTTMNRPELIRLLGDAEPGDVILIEQVDRLTRLDDADESDLVIITTGTTIDDLEPSLELARELIKKGIDKSKIVFIV